MIDLHDELVAALAGRYQIERELGHGGMAVVYLAHDTKEHRKVALKVMRPELTDELGTERFLQEIAITAPLVHPNILALYASGEAADHLYYTMPYVQGETLRQRLDREVQLPIADALAITRQVASALDYAHAHGAVHRDIKPENILLQGDHVFVADFGLARAITKSASKPLTVPGMVLGTVQYMSPEQCTPGGKANPASDIYSLGCVVFEMIAGVTPFRGATVNVVMSHHQLSPPPSLREERSSCPSGLDTAVRRALAKVPADRFRSAGEFVRALEASPVGYEIPIQASEPGAPEIDREAREKDSGVRRLRTVTGTFGLLAVLSVLGLYTSRGIGRDRRLIRADTSRIMIFPAQGDAGLPLGQVSDLLYEGAGRWRGVSFLTAYDREEAESRGGRSIPLDEARWRAVDHGAGRFIVPRLSRVGGELRLYSVLADVRGPEPLSERTIRLPNNLADADSVIASLADSLLLRGAQVESGGTGSRNLPAVQAYAEGKRAISDWNLGRADSMLAIAVETDPEFARAALWLAQARNWRQLDAEKWLPFAERASASGQLSPRESRLASALLLLARERYSAACSEYDGLIADNEREFAPWYGLGQCRRKDPIVVRDSRSPSGWKFRSSYHRGVLAYARALELAPALHRGFQPDAFLRLRYLLFTGSGMVAEGRLEGPDPILFHAYATWQGDSLAFVPYPRGEFSAANIQGDQTAHANAVRHQRELFARIASSWSAALPKSAGPKEAVALSLEMLGDSSALDSLRLGRPFASNRSYGLWLAVEEVFIRLVFARSAAKLDSVRVLADSLLNANSGATGEPARMLAPVAVLRGRCSLALRFMREQVPKTADLAGHLRADFSALTLAAAMGCREPDFLNTADRLVLGAIAARPELSATQRRQLEIIQMSRATTLVFPADSARLRRLADESDDYLWRAQKAALVGDTKFVRAQLERMAKIRGPLLASTVAPDALYPEAQLWISLGDSATARRWLDAVLMSPGWLERMLDDPVGVASLMRCFALRAQLATPSESRLRERWGQIVSTLWTGADPGPSELAARTTALLSEKTDHLR